jgi:hypothetical protein
MTDLSSIPDPTAEQFRQEYHFYRNQQPVLLGEAEARDGGSLPHGNYTRLLEGDLIPVTDRESQQLAKRCADLYDKFLASATVDGGGNKNHAANNRAENNNNNDGNIKLENSTNNATTNHSHPTTNNAGTTPPKTLHIPLQDFLEFTSLFHNLIHKANPSPDKDKEAQLQQRETALNTREASLARRESTANLLFSTSLLTQQLTSVWQQGYEAGYKPGFELGRRSAVPVAYQVHLASLGEVLRRVKDLRVKAESSDVGGMGMEGRELGMEFGKLEGAVEFMVRKTCLAAREGELGLDEMMGMVLGGRGGNGGQDGVELGEFLRMALEGEDRKWRKGKGKDREVMSGQGQKEDGDMDMEEEDSGVWI